MYITKLNSSLTLVMFSSPLSRSPPTSSWSWLWTSGAGISSSTTTSLFLGTKVLALTVSWLEETAACGDDADTRSCLRWCCIPQGQCKIWFLAARHPLKLGTSSSLFTCLPLVDKWEDETHKKKTKIISMSTFGGGGHEREISNAGR